MGFPQQHGVVEDATSRIPGESEAKVSLRPGHTIIAFKIKSCFWHAPGVSSKVFAPRNHG